MAEFQEVMKQAKRMCETQNDCEECPIFAECEGSGHISLDCTADAEAVERKTMDWAAAHPEPRYPTWAEAWRQLFPAADLIPCPRKHFGFSCACIGEDSCQTCVNRQMYPFVAKKLGIKPIGGNADA